MEMMFKFGCSGYYSSFLLGSFTLGRLFSSFAWGMIADRFGRKPVMLANVFATGVFAITFGLSRTFASALASRCEHAFAGALLICEDLISKP